MWVPLGLTTRDLRNSNPPILAHSKQSYSSPHTRRHWCILGFNLLTSFVPAFAFAIFVIFALFLLHYTLEDIVPRYFARSLSSKISLSCRITDSSLGFEKRLDSVHAIIDDTQDWVVQMFQVMPKSQVFRILN